MRLFRQRGDEQQGRTSLAGLLAPRSVPVFRLVKVFGEGDPVPEGSQAIVSCVPAVQGSFTPLRQVLPVGALLGGELLPVALTGALSVPSSRASASTSR
jgi:hypothetical protein